jgi:thiol-disulfide isomerase/thioredoxin
MKTQANGMWLSPRLHIPRVPSAIDEGAPFGSLRSHRILEPPHAVELRQSYKLSVRFLLPLWLLFAVSLAMGAADEKIAPEITPSNRLAAIQQEYEEAQGAYRKAARALPDTVEGEKKGQGLGKEFSQKQASLFMAAVDLAKANPKSEVGFAALDWMLMTPLSYHLPAGPPGLDLMTQQYADNPKIGRMVAILAYYLPVDEDLSCRQAVKLLKAVAEKNSERVTRGQAAIGLAWLAKHQFYQAAKPDSDRLAAEAETAFESVLRDYGDCPNLRNMGIRPATVTLGEEAKSELYELRHLRIGKVPPDIEAEDLNGTRFKLSDHRGKVILLVFWASWCGPCMANVPHEVELVERFKGRPFVLVGVNGDAEKGKAMTAVTKHRIPWRSFWNGPDGPGGPIAKAWNVQGWPTGYVIDSQGVIRPKDLHGKWLDGPLESLVSQAEKR